VADGGPLREDVAELAGALHREAAITHPSKTSETKREIAGRLLELIGTEVAR
jgi:hypothetical protein